MAGLALWRRLGRKGAALALLLALGTLVPAVSAEDAKKPAPKKQPAAQSAPATGGMRVFIDPATGQIRQPEAEDIQSLQPAAPAKLKAAAPAAPLSGPGGAVGMRVGDDQMVYSVATKNADGSISFECHKGPEKARQAVERKSAPGREANDR
jgi:hypothetical protein